MVCHVGLHVGGRQCGGLRASLRSVAVREGGRCGELGCEPQRGREAAARGCACRQRQSEAAGIGPGQAV